MCIDALISNNYERLSTIVRRPTCYEWVNRTLDVFLVVSPRCYIAKEIKHKGKNAHFC